ncbi:MAG: hypothetical protein IJM27_02200 [Eubacterium sp.]|nr:hypothetical protein [Eubacterium sp.]
MSDDLIRVKNASYARYEELLMQRDAVKKEAFQHDREYVRVFGDLILQVFRKKMECICKKKTIEYCRVFLNRGEAVDPAALQAYLRKEMEEYQNQLDDMIKINDAAKNTQQITQTELLKIKRIYHRLVKQIHPDINPLTNTNDELRDLWQRLVAAYNCNDLKEMEETEVLINAVLEKLNKGTMEIEIPDIDEKIAELEKEISRIKSEDPYQYKYLLMDPDMVEEKKEALRNELKAYEEYSEQLQNMLDEME